MPDTDWLLRAYFDPQDEYWNHASSWHPELTKGIFVPVFFDESDYIALVQHFLAAYFLASKARCASEISRDLVVDAD